MAQVTKLKSRIRFLEEQLSEKSEELNRYQTMGNAADEKIQALSKIHNDKIRSLMNSIQLLKKENVSLQNQGKEHKRSKLISQLNKQIDDQDIVIEVLRQHIYKKQGKETGRAICDDIIVKALTKGPERVRALSRQELKMEIEKLKNQILLFKTKKQTDAQPTSQKNILDKSAVTEQSQFENANEQLLRTIQQLKNSNESLKLEIKANQRVINTLEKQFKISSKNETQLTTLRSELEVAQRKVETLESLLKQTKDTNNAKLIQLYEREVKVEELQLQSKQTNSKLNLLQQNHGMQLEEMKLEKERLDAQIQSLTKENERLILENSANRKRQEEQKNKINQIRELNNKQKDELTNKLSKYEVEIQRIALELDQKIERIRVLELQLKEDRERLTKEKMLLAEQLGDLRSIGATKEQIDRLRNREVELAEEIRKFKEMVESSNVRDSSTGSDILMTRIKNYEKKILDLENLLKSSGKITDKQLQMLMSDDWQQKYLKIAQEVEKLRVGQIDRQLDKQPEKPRKNVEVLQLNKAEKRKLQNLSSDLSNMGLESVDQRILNNFDSDYQYSVRTVSEGKYMPKMNEHNRQLIELINSDLWDFIREDKIGKMLDGLTDRIDSDYGDLDDFDDSQWNKNFKQLEDLQSRLKKGTKITLNDRVVSRLNGIDDSAISEITEEKNLKKYDSDINFTISKQPSLRKIQDNQQPPLNIKPSQINRIENISSNLSSSVNDLDVSVPKSGQSLINIFPKKKHIKDKASRLPMSLENQDSDYEDANKAKLNLDILNSDVSMHSSIKSSELRGIDSDVSFRRKK